MKVKASAEHTWLLARCAAMPESPANRVTVHSQWPLCPAATSLQREHYYAGDARPFSSPKRVPTGKGLPAISSNGAKLATQAQTDRGDGKSPMTLREYLEVRCAERTHGSQRSYRLKSKGKTGRFRNTSLSGAAFVNACWDAA